ncbi:MAG: hypothetical protein V6Z81_00355 [Parvularculales bacterium]
MHVIQRTRRWLASHFEKMLYDNALLVSLLTTVWRTTGREHYRLQVSETIDWMIREMTLPGRAFAASLDADSNGGEGRFYTWSYDEVLSVLGVDAEDFCKAYDITPQGNWENVNILNRLDINTSPKKDTELAEETESRFSEAHARLFAVRAQRIAPALDDKVLADWNGLAIQALAQAGLTFNRPDWLDAALKAFDFVVNAMMQDGRLHHSWCAGKCGGLAVSDDYANMIRAALMLFETTGDNKYLATATDWLTLFDHYYRDKERGGYFYTASDAEALIVHTRPTHDNATPAANGVMVDVFARLNSLDDEADWQARTETHTRAFSGDSANNAFAMAGFLNGMDQLFNAVEITLCGGKVAQSLHAVALKAAPPAHVVRYDSTSPAGVIICRGQMCTPRLKTPEAIIQALRPRS